MQRKFLIVTICISIVILLSLVFIYIYNISKKNSANEGKGSTASEEAAIIIDSSEGALEDLSILAAGEAALSEEPEESDFPVSEKRETVSEPEIKVDPEEKKSMEEILSKAEGKYLPDGTGYIFIGDSRFVGMNDACGISKQENCFVVAKIGQGYSWFSETALKQVDQILYTKLYPKWKLIICLGVNDLENLEKYVKKYEAIREKYDIILESLNPTKNLERIPNSEIKAFNERISRLGLPYIDTYSILMHTGFEANDGLHFNNSTYENIYKGILLNVAEIEDFELSDTEAKGLNTTKLGTKKYLQSQITAANKYVPPVVPKPEETTQKETNSSNTSPKSDSGDSDKKSDGTGETDTGKGSSDGTHDSGSGSNEDKKSGGGSDEDRKSGGSSDEDKNNGGGDNEDKNNGGASDKDENKGGSSGGDNEHAGKIYVSGQWMTEAELLEYGLTPEQIEQVKRDGHL